MKLNKLNIAIAALAFVSLAGCKNEDLSEQHYDNKLYIATSAFTDEMLIKPAVTGYTREISVGTAQPVSHEITVSFAAAPELLGAYREGYYDPEAILLPAENYSIAEPSTSILVGGVRSKPVTVEFVNTNELDRDTRYVLPVTLASVTGIDVLASAKTFYFLFKGASLINVVANIEKNYFKVSWRDPSKVTGLTQVTMEALVRAGSFTREGSDSEIATLMGIEGTYLIRTGDTNKPGQLQIAAGSAKFPAANDDKVLPAGKWLHIAVTHDLSTGAYVIYVNGEVQSEGTDGRLGSLNLTDRGSDGNGFCIGHSWNENRWWPGEISECRIWNKIRTREEIVASIYELDPATEGLVAYWKFNEGTGTTIIDHSSNGNDLEAAVPDQLKWITVALPESEK